jgi:hypothetical protein
MRSDNLLHSGVYASAWRRRLFRKEYRGSTLPDHFGLAKPPSRFANSVPAAASA